MDVCSPKDGFVVQLHVAESASVTAGQPLFTLDNDDEEKTRNRIARLETVRALLTAQYQEDQQENARQIAKIAISMAKDSVDLAKYLYDVEISKGTQWQPDSPAQTTVSAQLAAKSKLTQTTLALQNAELDLKTFEFAITRHLDVSKTISSLLSEELNFNIAKQKRLTVLSPIDGKAALHMTVNSFAKLGRPVVSIS